MRLITATLLLVLLGTIAGYAQPSRKQKGRGGPGRDPFLNTQWWVGFRGGANITKAKPVERYSSFYSTKDPESTMYDKTYNNFSKVGGQAGIEITFYHQGFSVSFQPNYRRMSFVYKNQYLWQDANNPDYSLTSHYTSIQKLDYFELPLLLRYEPLKTKFRPFVQAGLYYSFLNNAYKGTEIKITDKASGAINEYTEQNITVGAKDLFIRSNMGWILGAGVSYPMGNVRLALDISYRHSTNNITSAANRYSNDRITGSGDVLDDVKLRNLSASVAVLIPLRFIMKGSFKAE